MYADLLSDFLVSSDTFRAYKDGKLLFASTRDGLFPLLDFINSFVPPSPRVVFDKIMGNAAALLCVRAACREVYSPLGSKLAVTTLDRYGISYQITRLVPYIRRPYSEEMCPMEAMSLNKSPNEFYDAVRAFLSTH